MSSCGPGCGCGEMNAVSGGSAGSAGRRREREHWRSLDELAGTEEARAFREREFPIGASELPEGIDRRSFVQLLGATLSLAGLSACRRPVEKIVPFVTPPESLIPGVAQRYATTMPFGLSGYGLVVESHEGRPTKIEGNELHPATRGSSSAQIQAAILGLYDPDRSRQVMQGAEAKSWTDFTTAWKSLEEGFLASGGAGLAVLSLPSSSPTLFRLAAAARARFPELRWVNWEPASDENVIAGATRFAGRPLRPQYDLAAARVVLSLDADLLLGETDSVAHARGFTAGRAAASEADEMNRLWVVESAFSTTGAMADHRLPIASSEIGALAAALAAALANQGLTVPSAPGLRAQPPAGVPAGWLAALAKDLAANTGRSLIVAGRDQPAAVHALALGLNAALGNLGSTVLLREPVDLLLPSTEELASLTAAMQQGAVSTLFILGGNPVYDAPADLTFAAALAQVANVVHLGQAADESAEKAHWHLPEAHFLEAWGDCRSTDGTASVVQPLILPLYGGHAAIELVQLLATGEEQTAHDLVRATWEVLLAPNLDANDPFASDNAFARVLHDGLLAGSALAPVDLASLSNPSELSASELLAEDAGAESLELVFRLSPAVHDGRFANVGWLQELPDAVSKMTWGNAALLAPQTAARLGVHNEQGVRLRVADAGEAGVASAVVELPVWIVPGQAENSIVVHLGYGREQAGRVGTAVGTSVYPLRRSASLGFVRGVTVEPSGERHRIAQTQDHGSMEGRPIVREATLDEWRHEPHFAAEMVEVPESEPLWEQHKYASGPQWAMTIDLNSCIGCNACVVACQSENNVPIVGHEQVRRGREMHWLRVDRYFSGTPEAPEMSFQPVPCMQCENAPCEQVCPVAATVHTADGLNAMVYNRCIGTRYCSNNCPYKVRRFNFFNFTKDTPETLQMAANPNVTVRSRGVMEKCTYCVQRIQSAKIDAKMAERPIADGDVRTACQQACPAQAIQFGDLRDPAARVNTEKQSSRNYVLLAELGNKPRTSYLARIRNPHPDLAGAHEV